MLVLWMAGFLAFAPPSPLDAARDLQDRPALEKLVNQYAAAAAKTPNDANAQYQLALACSYQAEVAIELHDKKAGQQAAVRESRPARRRPLSTEIVPSTSAC